MFSRIKEYRSTLPEEFTEFWSPVVITVGVITWLNSALVSLESLTLNGWNGWFNLIFGLAFISIGIVIRPRINWKWWARIFIPSGLAGFFFGVRVWNNQVFDWGIPITLISLILFIIGFSKAQAEVKNMTKKAGKEKTTKGKNG